MEYKTLVCLANSIRTGERCFAGKEISSGELIRPVSGRPKNSIRLAEQKYDDGKYPMLLDLVGVPLNEKVGTTGGITYQSENYMLAAGAWVKKGKINWQQALGYVDDEDTLWQPAGSQLNDRVNRNNFGKFSSSLRLIKLPQLQIEKRVNRRGKGKLRGKFTFLGFDYDLALTDPIFSRKHQSMKVGNSTVLNETVLLCLSLAEPFEGNFAYKLVAGVITQRDAGK